MFRLKRQQNYSHDWALIWLLWLWTSSVSLSILGYGRRRWARKILLGLWQSRECFCNDWFYCVIRLELVLYIEYFSSYCDYFHWNMCDFFVCESKFSVLLLKWTFNQPNIGRKMGNCLEIWSWWNTGDVESRLYTTVVYICLWSTICFSLTFLKIF